MSRAMENSEFYSLSREIEKALFNSRILRNHLTIEIKTPESWKQEYRVVYRNKKKGNKTEDENTLKCIRLPPRRKKVQRNLSVRDRKGDRLTIIPTELVNRALVNICEVYLSETISSLKEPYNEFLEKTYQDHINFDKVFIYDSKPEIIQCILTKLRKIIIKLNSESNLTKKGLLYLKRVYFLISTYKNFYIPIVKLEISLKPRDCILINYSVENLTKPSANKKKTSMSNWNLYFLGKLTLSFPLELESKASNHIRILSPPGMVFREAGITGLEDESEHTESNNCNLYDLYSNLDEVLDEDMVYFHISKENSDKMINLQKNGISKGKEKIKIKSKIGIDKDFPTRPSLVRILVFLMYFSALIPLFSFLFPYKDFVFGLYVASASALIVLAILVSLAVYSLDKRFLPDFMAGQVTLLIIVYAIELMVIIPFW